MTGFCKHTDEPCSILKLINIRVADSTLSSENLEDGGLESQLSQLQRISTVSGYGEGSTGSVRRVTAFFL
jgi:hypothetical protein